MNTVFTLHPHPTTPCAAVRSLTAELCNTTLHYRLDADVSRLKLDSDDDVLWRHTCFECFLGGAGTHYVEYNFAPDGRQRAYAFRAERVPDENAAVPAPLPTVWSPNAPPLELQVTLPAVPKFLGLCAVIETADGRLHYFALQHSDNQPDFHRRDTRVRI